MNSFDQGKSEPGQETCKSLKMMDVFQRRREPKDIIDQDGNSKRGLVGISKAQRRYGGERL
jgi:hypothetical protein